ncbi:hypothetical protein BDZ89DRAFT_1152558 [Hymenopellis radicata]|nr:hypothetical protein BDZ89DRAFT_1152558 [Hymenopellis radicata]
MTVSEPSRDHSICRRILIGFMPPFPRTTARLALPVRVSSHFRRIQPLRLSDSPPYCLVQPSSWPAPCVSKPSFLGRVCMAGSESRARFLLLIRSSYGWLVSSELPSTSPNLQRELRSYYQPFPHCQLRLVTARARTVPIAGNNVESPLKRLVTIATYDQF